MDAMVINTLLELDIFWPRAKLHRVRTLSFSVKRLGRNEFRPRMNTDDAGFLSSAEHPFYDCGNFG